MKRQQRLSRYPTRTAPAAPGHIGSHARPPAAASALPMRLDGPSSRTPSPARCGEALMGSVNWRKRGNRYLVSWRLDDGSQGGKTVDTPDEARDLVAEKRLEMRRSTWQGRRRGRLPFSRWADEWWAVWSADPDRSPTTLAATEIRLRRHVRPFFGDRPIEAISPC